MKLSEKLSELRNNILRDTSDLIGGPKGTLWDDPTLLRYIGDAERKFCRETLILRDSTTPGLTSVTLRTGVTTYKLNRCIMGIVSARYEDNTSDLAQSGHATLVPTPNRAFFVFTPGIHFQYPDGAPLAFYTDETLVNGGQFGVSLSVFPKPGAEQDGKQILLRVVRVPNCGYSEADLGCDSELPIDYELDVLRWAAYRALSTFDADAGAPTTAADHKAGFEEAVARAQMEMKRRMFTNITMKYGENGFRWVR